MAFMKYINDLIGILTLVVLTLPSIAANIDCDGKPFHCVNSTHFMICVDLGSGVSCTIDDFVIPCPPTTVCQETNRFECEFPTVPTTTTTIIAPTAEPHVTSVSETIDIETTTFYDETTSIPFEEYFNTLSTTTLSEDVLLTQQAIVTESILIVTDVTDKTDVIQPEFESNSTLSGTPNFTPLNNLSSLGFPSNVTDTVTGSTYFTGVIETSTNINVELNLTTPNTVLPENINLMDPKSNLTSNGTIPRGNILGNNSTTHYTPSSSAFVDIANAFVKKNIVTEETQSKNVARPEPNKTLSETAASVKDVPIYYTLLKASSTVKGSEAFVTNVAKITNVLNPESSPIYNGTPAIIDNAKNDLTSLNALIGTAININNVTENINVTKPNITLSETAASVDVVTHNPTSLDASGGTTINTEAVINDTVNLNVIELEPNTTLSKIPVSFHVIQNVPILLNHSSSFGIDIEAITNVTENINVIQPGIDTPMRSTPGKDDVITHDSTSVDASSSTTIDTQAATNVTENPNVFKPESNTTLSKIPEIVDAIQNNPTLYNASSNTGVVIEAITNVTENINVIQPGSNTTMRNTPGKDDVITHDSSSSNTTIGTEAVTNLTENLNVSEPEPNTILSKLPVNVVVIQNVSTLLNNSSSTGIDKEAITNVTENINVIQPGPNTTMRKTSGKDGFITHDSTSVYASSSTTIDTEAATNVTENPNVFEPEPNSTLSKFPEIVDVIQYDPTLYNASSNTGIDMEAITNVTENINVIQPGPNTKMRKTPGKDDFITHDSTSVYASSSTTIETEAATNVKENPNVFEPEPKSTLSKFPEIGDVIQNDPTLYNASSNTGIDIEVITNVTENINVIQTGPDTTMRSTPEIDDVMTYDRTSVDDSSSTTIDTEAVTNVTENPKVFEPEPNATLSKFPEIVDVIQNHPTLYNASSNTGIDMEAITNVTENINEIQPGPNTTMINTPGKDDVITHDSTSSSTTIGTEAVTNLTENLNVSEPEPNTILSKLPVSVNVIQNVSTLLNRSSSTGIDKEAITNVTENLNVIIQPGPNTTMRNTPGKDDVTTHDSNSVDASSSTNIDTEAVTNVSENLNNFETEPNTTLSKIPESVDVTQNNPKLFNALSSTGIDIEASTNVTDNINVIQPGPDTPMRRTPGIDDVITQYPNLLYASSSTAIDPETVTDVTENINVIKPGPSTLSGFIGSDDVVTRNSTSLKALSSTESMTNVSENLNVLKTATNTIMTEIPAGVDVVRHELTSLDTLSSTASDTEGVTNVTDNINLKKPLPNTTFIGISGSDDVTHDPTTLDASSSTVIDTESVTNVSGTLNVLKTEPTKMLSETTVSVSVVPNNPTSLHTSTTTAVDTKSMIENLNVVKPEPITTLNEMPERIDVILNDSISLTISSTTAVDTETVTNVTDNINVIKPEANTTLSGTLTSFDVVLNDPTSLNNSSSTAIDSVSNDVLQNELTTAYTPNKTASLNNIEPGTSDILLVNKTHIVNKIENYRNVSDINRNTRVIITSSATSKTYQDSSMISHTIDVVETTPKNDLEKIIPTQEIDSVTYSNVYHTDTKIIDNDQGVLTNQTDDKPVHREKVLSIITNKYTAPTPTFAMDMFTDSLVSVTDAPLEHPVSELKSSWNVNSIILDTYSTTIEKPLTDIPVSEPPTEVIPTDTTGVTSALDAAVFNDNIVNVTTPEFVSNTESLKEIYFITGQQLTPVLIVGETEGTVVNDNNQLVINNKPMDSSSIYSIDKNIAGDINTPVITENVDVFTNTEQTTLATTFTITETGQDFRSGLANAVSITESAYLTLNYLQNTINYSKVNAFSEAATIATTSTTTDSSKSIGVRSSTNIGQHTTKEVKDINVIEFMSETDTVKFYNTRTAKETPTFDVETTNESNPLISLLLNSATVKTLHKESTIPAQRKLIQEENVTKQEIYSESNIQNTGYGKPSEISTSTKNMSDVQFKTKSQDTPLIETLQAKQIGVSGQAEQSPADYLESVAGTLHSSTTERQIPEEVQKQQSPTAYYEGTSHNQHNAGSQQGSISSLHILDLQPTDNPIIIQNIPFNTSKTQIEILKNPNTTRDIAKKDIETTNYASLTKVNIKTETNVPSAFDIQLFVKANMKNQDNKAEGSQIVAQSGITSLYSKLAKNFSTTSIRKTDTLSYLEQITESWIATVVTNSSVQMKSSNIDKKPLITTTRPATETGKISKIEGTNVQNNTGPNLNVASNTGKQFTNVPRVKSLSIAAKPLIVVTSTTGPLSEQSYKISKAVTVPSALDPFITNPNIVAEQPQIVTSTRPNTAPWSIQIVNLPNLDPKAKHDNLPKNVDGGQTTVDHVVLIPKTEFINDTRIVIGQTTEQMITQTSSDLNSDVDIIMVDIMKPINANPELGEPTGSGSHLGISVIPKPPHKSPVEQSQKTEASESVEKSEGNEKKDKSENSEAKVWGGKPETPVSEPNEGASAIETSVVISKDSKFYNVNDNFDQKVTPETGIYNIIMESTIEMTTKKIEEKSDQLIDNIEQYSSTVSSTKKSAQTNVTHVVSPDLIKKSVKIKPIIVTAHISGSITSNIRNSTARYTPQTKSPLANKHNASVPVLQQPTYSHKFVCKPNKRGRFSDIKDCRKFYICLGRVEPIEGICPNNTVFSELRKQCTKNLSHCVRNSQFQCVSEGRFSDYLNDGIYYICLKNNVGKFIRFKLQCQSGYHLNKTSVRCALNTESIQSTSQQSTSDISKDSNQSVSWTKSDKLVKEPSKNKKFECKKEGKFPEANDCRKYYICKKIGKSQYQQKSKKCDSDELFHKDKKKCVDADSYECYTMS